MMSLRSSEFQNYNIRRPTRFVVATVLLSVVWTVTMARWTASDGRTAALLALIQVMLYAGYLLRTRDTGMLRLALFGAMFGIVELAADAFCVRFTGTLDYSPAHSAMLGLSPWWMPLAWMIVALQIGCLGAWAIRRFGMWRGTLLGAALGAINIP